MLLLYSAHILCTHSSFGTGPNAQSIRKDTRHTARLLTGGLSSSRLNKYLSLIVSFLSPLLAPNTTRCIRKTVLFVQAESVAPRTWHCYDCGCNIGIFRSPSRCKMD
ncbi:hypothetical protein EV421DRAFT_1130407 [Armillaria borealis]|uniref:Uncharacterized protein n=1 Tax=Armillaria borealis TaxID=47425 RepID=A0AA39J4W6_9AGAR|nr:hypothetical protein EV421DRAFT_1130407 [Armillaria borealis]